MYDNKDGDRSDDNDSSSAEEESETTTTIVKEKGSSTTVIKKHIPKRRKLEHEEADESLDTGLCLQDDEDLALQLLMK